MNHTPTCSRDIADIDAPEVDSVLLSRFEDYAPYNRRLALEGLMRSTERANALLDAVESGVVPPDSVGSDRIERLRDHPSSTVQRRARMILPEK